jgi:hypothetical protein
VDPPGAGRCHTVAAEVDVIEVVTVLDGEAFVRAR